MQKVKYCLIVFLIFLYILPVNGAEEQLVLTLTPTTFQLNIAPGDFWQSYIKIVNANPYDVTLYASTINFGVDNQENNKKFTPLIGEASNERFNSLASWIEVTKDPIIVPKEQTKELSFILRVPSDAPPGGHYGAIVIGQEPPETKMGSGGVSVSSLISSAFFVTVTGEVQESGLIQEFKSSKRLYKNPEAIFSLKFENTGNVHLRPAGDIIIYTLWGSERGKIVINPESKNILPKSAGEFTSTWNGGQGFLKFGLYKASAKLRYGSESNHNIDDATYFLVLSLKSILSVLVSFVIFVIFLMIFIRFYTYKVFAQYRLAIKNKIKKSKKRN